MYQQHRRALDGYQCISNAGLTADTRHIPLTGIQGTSEVPEVQISPQRETRGTSKVPQRHNSLMRELSIPPPIIGQGHMEVTSSTSSDGITCMVRVALEENRDADPEKSALAQVGIKIPHPETYSGSADLEELEIFVAGILRWLKMNQYLGSTNTEFQVNYLGTCLEGEAREWFLRNVEHFERDVHDWTLKTVVAGLQQRFLHTLTHHHASNRFESVMQGSKTIHEILNDLKKYTDRMVMRPDEYTFRRRFISALREPLRQEDQITDKETDKQKHSIYVVSRGLPTFGLDLS